MMDSINDIAIVLRPYIEIMLSLRCVIVNY